MDTSKDEHESMDIESPTTIQMLDDDCLVDIFSFIPPIPFFFKTLRLVNKQFFDYFLLFVTTCPTEELNYFKEINLWGVRKEDTLNEKQHYSLFFGEEGNNLFNIVSKRIKESTETIFFPFNFSLKKSY